MPIMFNGGAVLFGAPGSVAMNAACCCCCLCPELKVLWDAESDLIVNISGGITVTNGAVPINRDGLGTPDPLPGRCATWTADFTPTGSCSGDLTSVTVIVHCYPDGRTTIFLGTPGGNCNVIPASEQEPNVGYTCDPLSLTVDFETNELFPGGCSCGDGVAITVTITAPP